MNRLKFGDVIDLAIGGGWGKEEPENGLIASYVIRGADFPDITTGNTESLPLRYEKMSSVAKRSLVADDIILEISGGTKDRPTGRTVRIPETIIDSSSHPIIPASFCRLIRPNKDTVSPQWLYYYLQHWWNEGGAWEYQNQSTGISNFQFKLFSENFYITLPTLPEQHAIAEVLSALDDKIAANTRIMRTIMDLCLSLTQKATDGMDDKFLGSVAASISRGSAPKYADSGYLILNQKCIRGGRVTVSKGRISSKLPNSEEKILRFEDILVNSTGQGTLGRVARWTRVDDNVSTDSHVSIVRIDPDLADPSFVGTILLSKEKEIEGLAEGTTGQTELRKDSIATLPLRLPPAYIQREIGQRIRTLWSLSDSLEEESRTLAATRDELLPLLMSGKITVADAEKRIAE